MPFARIKRVLDLNYRRLGLFSGIVVAAVLIAMIAGRELTVAQQITLGVFLGAAGLWVSEAIPPFATAIMVVVLEVYLLGIPGGPLKLEKTGLIESYQVFLNPIASPIIILFFGGFILAVAATKHGFDRQMAAMLIQPFGKTPSSILFGVIGVTALFSMFMSNTATTAMMIAIVAPLVASLSSTDPYRKALVLAVPFAANVGGIGTIIGTPPNAVAASVLRELGHPVSFISWMYFAVPMMCVLLIALWALLRLRFPPERRDVRIEFEPPSELSWGLLVVAGTFTVTVLLWMTEQFHGIPSAVVALLPVAIFTALGIINAEDLKSIEWNVLILVAGGMSLGVAMQISGLSDVMVEALPLATIAGPVLILVVGAATVAISNFMSNTAAANLLIPIVTAIGAWSPTLGAVLVAIAASLAMSLPISTPPNAIAYATKMIDSREMAATGTIVSFIGIALLVLVMIFIPGIFAL